MNTEHPCDTEVPIGALAEDFQRETMGQYHTNGDGRWAKPPAVSNCMQTVTRRSDIQQICLVSLPSTVDNIHLKKNSSVLHLHPHQLPTNRRNTSQRRNQSECCRSSGRTQMLIHLELEFLCQNHSHTGNTGPLPRDTCPLWAPRPLQGVDDPPAQEQICHFCMENRL